MTIFSLFRDNRRWLPALVFIVAGEAQILQNRPELCGKRGQTVPLPDGTSFSRSDGLPADLTLKLKGGRTKIVDLELADSVPQVCPIVGDRLLVFGTVLGEDGPHVWIVSQMDGRVLDHIGSRSPVVSPDQHWLVFRLFYSPHVELATESYLLYDLTKDAEQNRLPSSEPGYRNTEGRQVYPVTANHIPFHVLDTLEPIHNFTSESFYWSRDSRFVAFGDGSGVADSVVLVKIGEDAVTTYVHSIKAREICESGVQTGSATLAATVQKVEFVSAAATIPDVWVYFSNIPCRQPLSQPLRLSAEDFQPADVELHKRIRPARK